MTTMTKPSCRRRARFGTMVGCAIGLVWMVAVGAPADAAFDSTSSGADAALTFACPTPQTIEWDPPPQLDPEDDNVFEFTTVTIPANCTVKLAATRLGQAPLVWLATGDVVIDGRLDLDGGIGHANNLGTLRSPAIPGPGGFAGGLGTVLGQGTATLGYGPGRGGISDNFYGAGAGHVSAGGATNPPSAAGQPYGSSFLIPLLGGSGGGGAPGGGGGGAGGGAILIASNSSIRVNGGISANGGAGGHLGGGGSGGAIRLVTPQLTGGGTLSARGGPAAVSASGGRVRLESTSFGFTGPVLGAETRAVPLSPSVVIRSQIGVTIPTLRVISVAGVPVPAKPSGGFTPADVTIDTADPVLVEIIGEHVPVGTVVALDVHHDTFGITTVQSTPLVGNEELSTATATATIQPGFSFVALRADWNP